jgi:hypothetical protein
MIFILGIERSATTWVANILDHHPKTDVYMEPLSGFNSRFEQWPARFTESQEIEEKARYFKKEFEALKEHHRFLFTLFSKSPAAWRRDLKWADFLIRKKLATDAVNDFYELNFHRKSREIQVDKNPPLQTVIKEVRLNFKADLIPYLDEQAKVLVTIREMASCVRSVMEQIKQGNLVELERDLNQRYGAISAQTICDYWFESYSSLIETLQNQSVSHRIVSHTDLLKNTAQTVDDMLAFLGLDISPGVREYLCQSNQPGSGRHSTRRSRTELLGRMQEDQNAIYPQMEEQLEKIRNHSVLSNFINVE